MTPAATPGGPPQAGHSEASKARESVADRLFRNSSRAAATLVLVILVAIGLFLLDKAIPAINANTTSFLTTKEWFPDNQPPVFGIAALVYGTVVTSIVALVIAVPVAFGLATFITQYAPKAVARPLGYVTDLLAAVPSVVYGLWGLIWLVPHSQGFAKWLSDYFGWIPIFKSEGVFGKSIFVAGLVLAIMVLPVISAITREVFLQVPPDHKEAAFALGATKWEMIRTAVYPYGRPGMISAVVLGFGRAIGETIAVALVLSANYTTPRQILTPGGNTIAANIANTFGDAGNTGRGALIASGLVLFVITLIVNFSARAIIARRAEFRGAAS
jgi:phosphate transport system permease protein